MIVRLIRLVSILVIYKGIGFYHTHLYEELNLEYSIGCLKYRLPQKVYYLAMAQVTTRLI